METAVSQNDVTYGIRLCPPAPVDLLQKHIQQPPEVQALQKRGMEGRSAGKISAILLRLSQAIKAISEHHTWNSTPADPANTIWSGRFMYYLPHEHRIYRKEPPERKGLMLAVHPALLLWDPRERSVLKSALKQPHRAQLTLGQTRTHW